MQEVHREKPTRPVDVELEQDDEDDELKEDEAGAEGCREGGRPEVAQHGGGG